MRSAPGKDAVLFSIQIRRCHKTVVRGFRHGVEVQFQNRSKISQRVDAPATHRLALAGLNARFRYTTTMMMMGMCDAWLLLPRHGPDGAGVHTGYAYGPMVRGATVRKRRLVPALVLQPPSEVRRQANAPPSLADLRPLIERPRGDAAVGCHPRAWEGEQQVKHKACVVVVRWAGASDGVMVVSLCCFALEGSLRRLCTSNRAFDHPLAGHHTRSAPRHHHVCLRSKTLDLAAHQGGPQHEG